MTITVKGGHWATGDLLRSRLDPGLRGGVERGAARTQGGLQHSSPVRSGALRGSWAARPPTWQGNRLISEVGTNSPYAAYQNTRTRNKGYIAAGVDAARAAATQEIVAGVAAAIGEAWVKT